MQTVLYVLTDIFNASDSFQLMTAYALSIPVSLYSCFQQS